MDNQNNQNRNNNQDPNRNNRQGVSFVLLVTLITSVLVLFLFQFQNMESAEEISYNKFLKMVEDGDIEKVDIGSSQINITTKKDKDTNIQKEYYTGIVNDDKLVDRLLEAGVEVNQDIPDTTSAMLLNIIFTFVPIACIVGLFVWFTRKMSKGGGMMGIGKSNAKMYVEKETGVTFRDVAGTGRGQGVPAGGR